jgi:hypothetical protein
MLKGRKPLDASSIKIMKVGDKDLSDIEGRKIGKIGGKSGTSTNY